MSVRVSLGSRPHQMGPLYSLPYSRVLLQKNDNSTVEDTFELNKVLLAQVRQDPVDFPQKSLICEI